MFRPRNTHAIPSRGVSHATLCTHTSIIWDSPCTPTTSKYNQSKNRELCVSGCLCGTRKKMLGVVKKSRYALRCCTVNVCGRRESVRSKTILGPRFCGSDTLTGHTYGDIAYAIYFTLP